MDRMNRPWDALRCAVDNREETEDAIPGQRRNGNLRRGSMTSSHKGLRSVIYPFANAPTSSSDQQVSQNFRLSNRIPVGSYP